MVRLYWAVWKENNFIVLTINILYVTIKSTIDSIDTRTDMRAHMYAHTHTLDSALGLT